jgi:hypothetical protein
LFWHASASAQSYAPVGPQTNVAEATVTGGGWSECYSDLYDNENLNTATMLSQCSGGQLMLACRPAGSGTLTLLAAAPRADVLFDTGDNNNVTHAANGSGWYYNEGSTDFWGFVRAGDSVAGPAQALAAALMPFASHPKVRSIDTSPLQILAVKFNMLADQ